MMLAVMAATYLFPIVVVEIPVAPSGAITASGVSPGIPPIYVRPNNPATARHFVQLPGHIWVRAKTSISLNVRLANEGNNRLLGNDLLPPTIARHIYVRTNLRISLRIGVLNRWLD